MNGKTKVLIVDDEVAFTLLLKLNLEGRGNFEVEIVNDSRRAIPVAKQFQPDIALLDVVMPGMDGGDIANHFQEDEYLSKVPIIMITALANATGAEAEAHTVHAEVMLSKPINMGRLLEVINDVLDLDEAETAPAGPPRPLPVKTSDPTPIPDPAPEPEPAPPPVSSNPEPESVPAPIPPPEPAQPIAQEEEEAPAPVEPAIARPKPIPIQLPKLGKNRPPNHLS